MARAKKSSTGSFTAWALAIGAVAASFAGGFRLGQTMPDAEVVPEIATRLRDGHRETIVAPEIEIPTRISPSEMTIYDEPESPPAAPADPVAPPTATEPAPAASAAPPEDSGDAPADAMEPPAATRVLQRTPVVAGDRTGMAPHEIERVAVVASPPEG